MLQVLKELFLQRLILISTATQLVKEQSFIYLLEWQFLIQAQHSAKMLVTIQDRSIAILAQPLLLALLLKIL